MKRMCSAERMLLIVGSIVMMWHTTMRSSYYGTMNNHDPYPFFTSLDTNDDALLYRKKHLGYYDSELGEQKNGQFSIAASFISQTADRGRNFRGEKEVGGFSVELGDLKGRWSTIAMLFGKLPMGKAWGPLLQAARNGLYGQGTPPVLLDGIGNSAPNVDVSDTTIIDTIANPNVPLFPSEKNTIDPDERLGFLSFPLKYRKRGVRFDLSARIYGDFGVNISTGVVSICQTVTGIKDLTCNFAPKESCPIALDPCDVQRLLTNKIKDISKEIGLDMCDFQECSVEEIRVNGFWRHIFEVNFNEKEDDWAHLLVIPHVTIGGTFSPGKIKNPSAAFALPFGNNGHNAIGADFGLSFDFLRTIEVGAHAGFTTFFSKTFCNYRVPNDECQQGIFPFTTNVRIDPGMTWHFGAKISAYYFLDHLSGHFEYMITEHKEDEVTLLKCDENFFPHVLEKASNWKAKMFNIGLTYDLTPNLGFGFFWQAPHAQRNAYKSTTVMISAYASF